MNLSLSKLVEDEGILDILLALEKKDLSFIELKKLNLSPSTLLARLREAQRRNLVNQSLVSRRIRKSVIKYTITDKGKAVITLYEPLKGKYIHLRGEIQKLEEQVRERKRKIKWLLSSQKETELIDSSTR